MDEKEPKVYPKPKSPTPESLERRKRRMARNGYRLGRPKLKAPLGRKSILTQALSNTLLKYCKEHAHEGLTKTKVCGVLGVCLATLNKWIEDEEDFKEVWDEAWAYIEEGWVNIGKSIALGEKKGNAVTYIYLTKRVLGWREEGTNSGGNTINIQQMNVQNNIKEMTSDELAKFIEQRTNPAVLPAPSEDGEEEST